MTVDSLEPQLRLLTEEYVLVQAWKKTASYIRSHNWYSDTLELDRTAINLPRFIADLSERLRAPEQWSNDPLRIVPAPKSQQWRVNPRSNQWEPTPVRTSPGSVAKTTVRIRPLAHVSLRDQVASTAVMLCLADRVETIQGDTRDSSRRAEVRKRVISYGNRLFCDARGTALRHRWGSVKLYREYYQDYQTFLSRPEIAAESISERPYVVIVHSDIRQFYDRVRPTLLANKLGALAKPGDDPGFYALANRLLSWQWYRRDFAEVSRYAQQSRLSDFSRVALPQGLVAAGFFANVALLDFDQALREAISAEIRPGVRLEDAARYVDDLRIVLTVDPLKPLSEIEELTRGWLQELLARSAEGLEASEEKTKAAVFRGTDRPLVRQSRTMDRIQRAVSGGFDAIGSAEILDAVQGLIRSQQRYSEQRTRGQGWPFSPIPDVRDATVARFAAGRFRSTYRSLRPLLSNDDDSPNPSERQANDNPAGSSRVARTQADLDDEARAFALGLIENWVEDPSNVRLLRIGLDLWPAADVLKNILDLLKPYTVKGGPRNASRRVAWYCLSEILRAGATETGFVEYGERLPTAIDIAAYRQVLRGEAVRLTSVGSSTPPWYLRQQALLFLAATDAARAPIIRAGRSPETKHYRELIRFLRGEGDRMKGADFATLVVLARRSFLGREMAIYLTSGRIDARRLEQIAERDPSFAVEILSSRPDLSARLSPRLRADLCLARNDDTDGWTSLAELVLERRKLNSLRNELAILRFASKFLESWLTGSQAEVITPCDVLLKLRDQNATIADVSEVRIVPTRVAPGGSIYRPPDWCPANERWRFHLGYLLRFILAGRADHTAVVRPPSWKEAVATYRAARSHWYQRLYGLFSGHSAFGDDWLPISDWIEQLLFALLRWPGCRVAERGEVLTGIEATRNAIEARFRDLSSKQGGSNGALLLPLNARLSSRAPRPLRACIVQTVIPTPDDFRPEDLTLSEVAIRRRHRNHLSAALAAIERMLDLRETHKGCEGRLDWLILPELSVHPQDVKTHLVPFARAHKAIILAGLTYQALLDDQPLVNSALWVIPERSAYGLQTLIRRQGKHHLAPDEERLNAGGPVLAGFRPCQWLVGYDWAGDRGGEPLWLTASICYDATELALLAQLCHHSDVLAIPALNKDVNTFDQMALALHYHMFQYVILANNGLYGGSNAYAPYRDAHVRQVFHLHGQPQASVAFLEIDDIAGFLQRKSVALSQSLSQPSQGKPTNLFKTPPAGMNG